MGFTADRVVIRDSLLSEAFLVGMGIRAKEVVIQNSAFHFISNLFVDGSDSIKILGSDFETGAAKIRITGANISIVDSDIDNNDIIELQSSDGLVLKNSHVSAGSVSGAFLITAVDDARISHNVLETIGEMEIDAGGLVVRGNIIGPAGDVLLITAVDDASVSDNVISKEENVDINAGGLLVLQKNDFVPPFFTQIVSFSGSSCRVKNNTFAASTIVTNNCP